MTPNTSIGIAYSAIFTFTPKPAISQAPVVVPRLAPKMMPIPAPSVIRPALRKEIAITETSELDCMMLVVTMPKPRLRHRPSVVRRRSRSSTPPVKILKPSSMARTPNRKMATPAAICLKCGLTHRA